MARAPAFQAGDAGSIPVTYSILFLRKGYTMPRKAVKKELDEDSLKEQSAEAVNQAKDVSSKRPSRKKTATKELPALKTVKRIPGTENGSGVRCMTTSGREFLITQCLNTGTHTLWRTAADGYDKLASAKSPFDLYPMIPWES